MSYDGIDTRQRFLVCFLLLLLYFWSIFALCLRFSRLDLFLCHINYYYLADGTGGEMVHMTVGCSSFIHCRSFRWFVAGRFFLFFLPFVLSFLPVSLSVSSFLKLPS